MTQCFTIRGSLLLLIVLCGGPAPAADSPEPPDPRRPAAITTEGVPVTPPELAERLRQYENIRGAGFSGWSPDGRGMLIQTRFAASVQLHRVYEPGGRREQITFFDEPVEGAFIPRASDDSVIVSMSRGGDENDQLYFLDRAKFATTLLTDGKSRNLLGPIAHDGSKMAVLSNRRNGRDTDVYVADCRRPDSLRMLLEVDGEQWYASDWNLDGSRLLVARYVSVNESYPAILDVEESKSQPLPLVNGEKASYDAIAFAPDGGSIYLATDARGEFSELARLDLKTGKYAWLSADLPWDIDQANVDPRTGVVAFAINADGASRLFVLDGERRREVELPLCIVSDLEFSPDGSRLGITLAEPSGPADAWSMTLSDGELTRWTFSEIGGLNPAKFVQPQRIAYKSFDGRDIPAYAFLPKDALPEKKAAVLIDIHGGPEGQYRPYFSGTTQFLAADLGMAVIAPNVRGSSGYGKTYLKLDNAELREDSVKDIGALLDWIAEQPQLDAERVAVTGSSYGGYMTLAALVHYPERIRAGIDVVGIANFITFLEQTAAYRQDLRRAEYGDERDPQMRAVFERINPTSGADRIRSALLVAHGRNDPRVPIAEAEQIAAKVRSQGRPVWTVYAENEGHGFAKKENRDYLREVTVMFLQTHLAGDAGQADR